MTDEAPTPRETGSHDRGRFLRQCAEQLAYRALSAADQAARVGTTDIPRGVALRGIARRLRALCEDFAAWERGEATFEQRLGDLGRWETLKVEAFDAGVR